MSNPQLHLVLLKDDNPEEAWTSFEKFVKDTGGNDVNLNDERDFFDQWEDGLKPGEDGVLFTRSSRGTDGEMTAKVIKIARELELKTKN